MKYTLTIVNLILITFGAFAVVQSFYTVALSQIHIGHEQDMTAQLKGKIRNQSDEIADPQ